MKKLLFMITVFAAFLILAGWSALQTGLARRAFFEIFAFVKGVEVPSPTVLRELPEDSPYQHWLLNARAEIPVFDGLVIDDISQLSLLPWPQMGEGINGLYLRLANYQIIDGRLLEIPVGGRTVEQRQFFEKGIYFIEGSGYTLIQQEGEEPQRVDWSAGSLISIPLNVRHWHVNEGLTPVRLLVVSSFPFVINAIGNEAFIEDNTFVFEDRYDGSEDYYDHVEQLDEYSQNINRVEDIRSVGTEDFDYRGEGNRSARWIMAGNRMLDMHISEMPAGMYKKAHRHSGDAFILLLSGKGFSLTWPEGQFYKNRRIDWKAGTLFVPPIYWYHQHFNTGNTPARYLAINPPVLIRNLGLRYIDQLEQDLPEIRETWDEALKQQQ
jgi:gentisate 1,2-dioxygenase